MDDPKAELPPLSAKLLHETERLQELEREKRAEQISTPDFHRLADEVVRRARNVFAIASEEEQAGDRVPTTDESIDDVGMEQKKDLGHRP